MFGLSDLSVIKQNGILLDTRKGSPIANTQGGKVAAGRISAFREMCRTKNWTLRRNPEGLYNCAGLVWASRRTGISELEDWQKILREDGYRQIMQPKVDDFVLYCDAKDKSYLHVGRVVNMLEGITPTSQRIPLVLSKWGHDLGECYHFAESHGFSHDFTIKIEFWTERPEHEPSTST